MKAHEFKTPAAPAKKNAAFFAKKADGAFFGSQQPADHFFPGSQSGDNPIQTKLTVGQPNDVYEKEADTTADKVVHRLTEPGVQKCEACDKKDKVRRKPIFESEADPIQPKAIASGITTIQRKPSSPTAAAPASVEGGLKSSKGAGSPLPKSTRQKMESGFGADFSGVRIHDNSEAKKMNKDLNAQAFTHGKDIYFNAGKYNPSGTEGQRLLAHELTHVVQQGGSRTKTGSSAQNHPNTKAATPTTATTAAATSTQAPASIAPKTQPISEENPADIEPPFPGTSTSNDIQKDGAPPDPSQGGCTPTVPGPPYEDSKTGFKIDPGPAPKVITAPEITLPKFKDRNAPKFNVPLSFLAGRIDTDQTTQWVAEVKKKNADTSTDNYLKNRKKDDTGLYFLKSNSTNFILFGTSDQIKELSYIPKWDRKGAPRQHQVDHIVELQIGGKDETTNYELLDAKANNSSGAVVQGQVYKTVRAAIKAFKALCIPNLPTFEEVTRKENPTTKVNFQKVKDFSLPTKGEGADGYWTIGEIETGFHLQQLRDMTQPEYQALQGSKTKFILFVKANEGSPHSFDTPNGKAGPKNSWLPGIDLLGLTISDGAATGDAKMGTITVKLSAALAKKFKMEPATPIEIGFTRIAGLINAGALVLKEVTPKLANLLKFVGLSPVTVTNFDLADDGITMSGFISADVPLIKDAQIDFSVQGPDVRISKTFNTGEINLKVFPKPFVIDDVSLSIFASTEHGFGVEGDIDFSIKGIGKGIISGIGDTEDGFGVKGEFIFDSQKFKGSSIGFSYLNQKWTINGAIVIPENSGLKGIDHGKLTVVYTSEKITADGETFLTVPGLKKVQLHAELKDDGSFMIHTKATLKSLPGIKDGGTVDVTVSKAADASDYSLSVTGEVDPNLPKIPKLSPHLTFSYIDGLFKAEGKSDFGDGDQMISGFILVGVTNGIVDKGVLQPGSSTGALGYYGTGALKFHPVKGADAAITVKIDSKGVALFSADLDVHVAPFEKLEKEIPILDIKNKIPLVGVPFLNIGLELGLKAGIYMQWLPLDIVVKGNVTDKTYDDLMAGKFDAALALTLTTSGKIGLEIDVSAAATATATVFVGGAKLTGSVKLEADAEVAGNINAKWNGEKGLKLLSGKGTATASLNLILALDGRLFVDLDLIFKRTNLWERIRKLAESTPKKLYDLGIEAPFEFDENNKPKPLDPDKITFKPALDKSTAEQKGTEASNPDDGKGTLKDDDSVQKDIRQHISDTMRGKVNQSIDRYTFASDLQNRMLKSTDEKLKNFVIKAIEDELRQIESEEFDTFKNDILSSKDSKTVKLGRIDSFQKDYITVDRALLDTLRSEVNAQPDPAPAANASVSPKLADSSVPPPTIQQVPQTPDSSAGNIDQDGIIQRQPHKSGVVSATHGDVAVNTWEGLGQLGIGLYGEPWVQIRWDPDYHAQPDLKILTTTNPYTASLEISANTDIDITVNKHVEEKFAKLRVGGSGYQYHFVARGHRVTLNKHLQQVGIKTIGAKDHAEEEIKETRVYGGQPEPGQRWDPEMPINPPPKIPDQGGNFFWLFDNSSQMDGFIKAWPKWYWIAEISDGGEYMALHFDEPGMQVAADRARKQDDPGIASIYINGASKDPWLINDMFYRSKASAGDGGAGSTGECFIFQHGDNSFGRVALDHKEALAEWGKLDKAQIDDARTKKIGEYPFTALHVKGSSGQIHEIDVSYLEARDTLFAATEKKRRNDDASYNPFASNSGWDDVLTTMLWLDYVSKAIDRPDFAFPMELDRLMAQNSGLEDEIGAKLLREVEWEAKEQAILAVTGALNGLTIYATDEGAERLVQKMIFMKWSELYQTVQFIGVPIDQQIHWIATFLDQAKGAQIWMGDEIDGVSVAAVKDLIGAQVKDMRKFIGAIATNDVKPLYMEGTFGNEIRKIVYLNRSFDLAPEDFPHQSGGSVPLSYDHKGLVGSEAGGLFARAAAKDAEHKHNVRLFKMFLLVVASVVLVIVAGAAGAFFAGIAFGTTATGIGLVAFTVTEIAISAGIVTLASPGMQTFIMSGGSATAEDYKKAYSHLGKDYLTNLITFGFFKALGAATKALSVAGAGGKEAFEASKAWQAADVGMRVVTSGGAMIGIGVLNQYMETGKIPDGQQMQELLFETALSVVLLEVGSYAARGPLKSLQELSRNIHLGEFAPQIDEMLGRARDMRSRIAELSTRPNAIKESGPKLVEDQIKLLTEQKELVAKMSRKPWRFVGDVKDSFNKITGDLDLLINQLKDIDFFRKTNIRPTGRETVEEAVFTYERGREKDIIDYYGKENVKEIEGRLEVTQGKRKLIFRIATDLDPSLQPDGTREPQALQSWRSSLGKRKMALLEKAFGLAETNPDLEKIQKTDPSAMDDKDLLKFEKQLDLAEKNLGKIKNQTPVDTKSVRRRPGELTEQWRQRLHDIKINIRERADLLGLDYPFEALQTQNPNLKPDTLERYADILEAENKAVNTEWDSRMAAEKGRQATEPERSMDDLKSNLRQRQQELARRAEMFGTSDKAYMEEATEKPRAADELSDLRERETRIERAEAILDQAAARALKKAMAKFGKATIDAARMGEFSGLSDQQVGDVMRLLQRAAGPLSPEALRGAFYASLGPPSNSTAKSVVPLENAVSFARSNAELNFVLESYLAINEAGIEGSYQLMRDATTSRDKWKGAVWQLEVIRFEVGIAEVKGVEIKEPGREIDILTRKGQRIECKDWSPKTWDDAKVKKQFTRDLNAATDGGVNPKGLKDIIWMFRDPPPRSRAVIRSTMRAMLEDFIGDQLKSGAINDKQEKALLDAFDNHDGLFSVVVAPKQPTIRPAPPPPLKRDDKDDKDGK